MYRTKTVFAAKLIYSRNFLQKVSYKNAKRSFALTKNFITMG